MKSVWYSWISTVFNLIDSIFYCLPHESCLVQLIQTDIKYMLIKLAVAVASGNKYYKWNIRVCKLRFLQSCLQL